MSAREQVEFLAGSRHRVAVAECLREGPARPSELEEQIGASRATVQRALSGLSERDWVRKRTGEYRLTAAGRLVLRAYGEFVAVAETVDAVSGPLALLDPAVEDPPIAAVRAATVTVADATSPHAPIERYAEALRGADVDLFCGVSPIYSTVFEEIHQPLLDADVPVEVVVDEATYEVALQRETAIVDAARGESFDLYVSPEPLGIGLSLFDGRAFVGAYDGEGRLRACIDGTGDPLREWVRSEYRCRRERARLVEPP
ncbi:hypothetical protein BRC94_13505 [Halobacteriales archaeon QS_5_70_17]|nr:MAG: hypothetical protein BRC94_13505 [Halobacteriales archaeon QS_5_70_17]